MKLQAEHVCEVWRAFVGPITPRGLYIAMAMHPRVRDRGSDAQKVQDWLLAERLDAVGALTMAEFKTLVSVVASVLDAAERDVVVAGEA